MYWVFHENQTKGISRAWRETVVIKIGICLPRIITSERHVRIIQCSSFELSYVRVKRYIRIIQCSSFELSYVRVKRYIRIIQWSS